MRKIIKFMMALCMIVTVVIQAMPVKAITKQSGYVIDVTDFGADPSGKTDSTKAFIKALDEAKDAGVAATINFPKGEYHFWKDYATKRNYHTSNTSSLSYPEKSIAMLIENMNDIKLQGNGSSLIMHGDMMAIAAVNSKNIEMENFILDYRDADTIDISVVGSGTDGNGKAYTDFYVPANYNYRIETTNKDVTWMGEISPVTNRPYWEKKNADFCVMLVIYKGYDQTVARASDKQGSNPFNGVSRIAEVKDNVLRFTYQGNRPKDQELGNIFLLSDSATRKTTGAFFWESENVKVTGLDVHYLSGFGWLTQMCKDVEFNSVNFLPRYGSGKYTTSNADQLHVAGCSGYYNVIDCNFSMAHDDPINVHGSYMRVEEVISKNTLRLAYINGQQGGFQQFHPGDDVLFYSRTYLELAAGISEDKPLKVKSSIGPGEAYNGTNLNMRTEIVTFEEDFSEETLNDLNEKIQVNSGGVETQSLYVAENVTYTPQVTIKGNHMKSIPTRGILCTTRKPVLIEDNVFDNMAMANIFLSNDADYWYESGPIRNMTIRNNEFYIRPSGQSEWGDVSGIFVDPVVVRPIAGSDVPAPKGDSAIHKNINIEGNTFHMANDNVVTANGVDGMRIKNNKIIRDNPNIKLNIKGKAQIGIHDHLPIQVKSSERLLPKDVFRFTNCKNVEIAGNQYDTGFNLNVKLSGKMTENDIDIRDHNVTINRSEGNFKTSLDDIHYISSDPSIAYMNEEHELVGVKEGTVEVYAYTTWNHTIIKSEPIIVEIGDTSNESLTLKSDKTFFTNENDSTLLQVNQDNVRWEIIDPITREASDKAVVQDGKYIAKRDGAVLIQVSNDVTSASLLMVNSFPISYGDVNKMNNDILIENKHADKLFSNDQYQIGIIPETGSELYGPQTKVNNLIKYKIPQALKHDVRIQVEVDGLPPKSSGWNNAGILLFKDGDNYLSLGKKNHYNGFVTVYEVNAKASETGGNTTDNAVTKSTLEIEIINDLATLRYKDANGNWQTALTQNVSSIINDDVYLAFSSWLNGGSNFKTTFKNVRIAKASETTTTDMSNTTQLPFFESFANDRPDVSNVNLQVDGLNQPATVTCNAYDETGLSSMLYEWIMTDKNNEQKIVYTKEPAYTPKTEGKLQVRVIAFDHYGKPGNVAISQKQDIVMIPSIDDTLSNVYINGNRIKNFSYDSDQSSYLLPKGTKQLRISYDIEDAGMETLIKNEQGQVIAELNEEHEALIDVQNAVSIHRGNKSYYIHFEEIESNSTSVSSIHVNGKQVDLHDEVKKDTNSYFMELDQESADIRVDADQSVSSIDVETSFFLKKLENEEKETNRFSTTIDMTAGINAFYIHITAADGVTKKTIRLYLFKAGFNDAQATDIKINGNSVKDFNPEKTDYTIYVSENESAATIEVDQKNKGQTTSITLGAKRIDGNQAKFQLKKGLNKVTVINKAKNIWDSNDYILNIIVISDDNADLLELKSDQAMSAVFEPEQSSYDIYMNNGQLTLSAKSQVEDAVITMDNGFDKVSAKGYIDHTFNIYEGSNTIRISVLAKDGITKKVYCLHITAEGLTYASDLKEESAYVGYGTLGKDVSSSSGQIALIDDQMQRVAFTKGLGVHAVSEIIYDITDKGFTAFEAYVGVDYYQVNQNSRATIDFQVYIDNELKFDSGVMTVQSPMKKINIDVTNASKVTLHVGNGGDNINYDHGDWADAKFIKPLQSNPTPAEDTAFVKTLLKNAIDKANAAEESGQLTYLAPSVKKLILDARDAAVKVYDDETATIAQVMEAWMNLADAMHYMNFVANKEALQTLVDTNKDLDMNDYKEGVEAFNTALANAKAVLADDKALQARIDEAYKQLYDAVQGLVEKDKVSKEYLDMIVTSIKEHVGDGSKYKQDANWNTFVEALSAAENVLADDNATQEDVEKALSALTGAYEDIRLEPTEDQLDELNSFVDKAGSINRSLYTNAQLKQIDTLVEEAKSMLKDFDSKKYGSLLKDMEDTAKLIDKVENKTPNKPANPSKPSIDSGNGNVANTTKPSAKPNTSDATNTAGILFVFVISGCVVLLNRKKNNMHS